MNLRNKTRAELQAVRPYVFDTTEDAMLVNCLDTFKIWCLKDDVSLTPSLYRFGYWESWITSWFTHNIQEGDFVVDIGANCGYYTMLFDNLVGSTGRVVAYEPNPVYIGLLTMTSVSNNADFLVEGTALGDKTGVVDLVYPGEYTGSASIMCGFDPAWGESHTIRVPCAKLDDEFEGMDTPSLMKIDAESAEEVIWNGGKSLWYSDNPPVVVMEYSPTGIYSDRFTEELFEYGEVTQINFEGVEEKITPEILHQVTDWVMLVIRRRF